MSTITIFKKNHIIRFLKQGDKVKAAVFFRGREIVHQSIGRAILDRLVEELAEVGAVEARPKMEGPNLIAIFAPKKAIATKSIKMNQKLKTHKGAAKRFKVTATGKIKRHHSFARHILTKKSARRKRKLGKAIVIRTPIRRQIARMLPYA